MYGATVYGVRGSYDDCSRLVSEFAGEVEWGIVNVNLRSYYAEGSKTLAFEIVRAARLGDPRRRRHADRLRRDVHQGLARVPAVQAARADRRRGAAAVRRSGRGLRAGRVRVRRGPARHAGAAGDGRLVDRDRQPGRRRPRRSRRRARPAAPSTRCPRTRSARTSRCSPRRAASSARARPASRSARSARPSRRGELGEQDRVVVLVTGTGLKTPQLVRGERPDRRDRRRRRRAARRARSDGVTDDVVDRAARGDHRDRPRARRRRQPAARDRAAAARPQARERDSAPRSRPRGGDARAALRRERRAALGGGLADFYGMCST